MGSLFDVPHHLVMIYALAASGGEIERPAVPEKPALAATSTSPSRMSEQVWLAAVQSGAGGDDMRGLRASIFKTTSGRFYVAAEAQRQRVPALRSDPGLAGRITFDLARTHAEALTLRLGREPTAAELYAAQALGVDTAASLIVAADKTPDVAATKIAPALSSELPAAETRSKTALTAAALWQKLNAAFAEKMPKAPVENPAVEHVASVERAPARDFAPLLPAAALKGTTTSMREQLIAPGAPPALAWATEVYEDR